MLTRMRNLLALAALLLAFVLGAALVWHFTHREPRLPDAQALVLKIREVARLETLDVSLYKKIDFSPDPQRGSSARAALDDRPAHRLPQPRLVRSLPEAGARGADGAARAHGAAAAAVPGT